MARSAVLLAVALLAGAAGAQAADLALPPPLPPPLAQQEFAGWYLRGDIGVAAYELGNLNMSANDQAIVLPGAAFNAKSIGDAAFAGAGVGYQVNSWLRLDATGEYRTASQFNAVGSYADVWDGSACGNAARCFDMYHGQMSSAVFLGNAYFDMGTWYGITPFVGGGVGFANTWLENFTKVSAMPGGAFGYATDRSQMNFAWQVGAGLSYNVSPALKLEVAYRYLDLGNYNTNVIACMCLATGAGVQQSFHLASNDVKVGFRYVLPSLIPPPPPPPLVRKY